MALDIVGVYSWSYVKAERGGIVDIDCLFPEHLHNTHHFDDVLAHGG
jgi:hypothetical protein